MQPGWIFALGATAYVAVFHPGFLNDDSLFQLQQARRNEYGDWHSPLMSIIWRPVDMVLPGATGMLLLQTALVWGGLYGIWRLGFRAPADDARYFALALAAVMFTPQIFGIAGVIWKDMLLWGTLTATAALALWLERGPPGLTPGRGAGIAGLVLLCAVATALRTNGLFAMFPILAWGIYAVLPRRDFRGCCYALAVAAPLTLLLFAASTSLNRAIAHHHQRAWVSVAFFDVAGVIRFGDDAALADELMAGLPANIRGDVDAAAVAASYDPRVWYAVFALYGGPLTDPVPDFTALSDPELAMVARAWRHAVLGDPTAWLAHRWAAYRELLGLSEANLWLFAHLKPFGVGKRYRDALEAPAATWLQQALDWRLQAWSSLFIFRPWFHALLLCGAVAAWLAARPAAGRWDVLFLALSGLLHEAALFVVAPSADYRYSHYMVFIALIVPIFIVRDLRRRRTAAAGLRATT